MPYRIGSPAVQPDAPKPFSRKWLQTPPQVPTRRVPVLPKWLPSERALVGCFVLLLVFVTAIGGNDGSPRRMGVAAPIETPTAQTDAPTATAETVAATEETGDPQVEPTPSPTLVPGINVGRAETEASTDGALLPQYRILSYYGHPLNDAMGIVGEFPDDKDGLLAKLQEEAANYEAADPSHPVKMAIELIASVGQNWPAENNTYLMHTDAALIDEYARFCEENGLILILDVQIGHSTVKDEIESVREWLELPFVHLALDPEFAMPDGVIPGSDIGSIDAKAVAYAQDALGQMVDGLGLPPKLLIVHRFTESMLTNEQDLEAVPGVQLVIDFDGFGDPAIKESLYGVFTGSQRAEYPGIKLFYKQDHPLMTAAQVVAMEPSPLLVIYQ
jgi:hypothetical protein